MIEKDNKQKGAVSLFVVIFAALLMMVVTVSFVRIMTQDQQQASTTDLSQSAYDAAQAGVEDAKRALLRLKNICEDGADAAACTEAQTKINSITCNDAVEELTDVKDVAAISKNGEINIQTGESNNLDQAYTCVTITMDTDNYIGELGQDVNKLIPIIGVSSFDTIKIEWFSLKDLQGSALVANIPGITASSAPPLLSQNEWTVKILNRPSIMRAQLIQFNNAGFSLSDFEGGAGVNGSNNTLLLYPSAIIETTKSFSSDTRKTAKGNTAPTQVTCNDLSGTEEYACSATITLPRPVVKDITSGSIDHVQYLNLSSLYKKSNYRITLWDGSGPAKKLVKFDAVQPEVDSTGRTNNLFRRVKSRVELTDINFPYPDAAVDITGNLCKDFRVTNDPADYQNSCSL